MLLVAFQSDPKGSLSGIGVKSMDTTGSELSAPFALDVGADELKGKFFYDQFIAGPQPQAIAARSDWDRGFMLLTKPGLKFRAFNLLSVVLDLFDMENSQSLCGTHKIFS